MHIPAQSPNRLIAAVAVLLFVLAVNTASADAPDDTGGFAWNSQSRTAVVAAFARHYLPSEDADAHLGWQGNVATCDEGSLSAGFLGDTMRRINWFRAQAGVPASVVDDPELDAKAQQAAVLMANAGGVSHDPATSFPGNPCLVLSDGVAAASKSNLAFGAHGPFAINYLVLDTGVANSAVGHRRWTLYPRQKTMGNGAVPPDGAYYDTHVQYVFATPFLPAGTPKAVPWPNEGFVPWQVVPNDDAAQPRWSFAYPGADFSAASVTVQRTGSDAGALAVEKEPIFVGYGDNTLVWKVHGVAGSQPADDRSYHVAITGVANAPFASYEYDVTVIDPFDPGIDMRATGNEQPAVGASSTYAFDGFPEADAYEVRSAHAAVATWTEGAEDEPAPAIVDLTSASYELRDSSLHASGTKSFHLAAPSHEESEQSFLVDRIVVPTDGSHLLFRNLRRCASASTTLQAQVSLDQHRWQTLWSRAGTGSVTCKHSDWDSQFADVDAPLPAELAGRTVSLRFLFRADGPAFLGTSSDQGFFVDDISVSDSEELTDATVSELDPSASGFSIVPEDTEALWLQVRGRVATTLYGWSTPTIVLPVSLCGDANSDGKVSAADALYTLRAAVGAKPCPLALCDANGNKSISANDALLILKAAVGSAVELRCSAA